MNLSQVAKIARREYLARVRSRAFRVMTVLVPALMVFYTMAVPVLTRSSRTEIRIAIVDADTGIGSAFAERLAAVERPRVTVTDITAPDGPGEDGHRRFTAMVQNGALDAYILVEHDPRARGGIRARYFAREVGDQVLRQQIANALRLAAVSELLSGTGVDVDAVRQRQQLGLDMIAVSNSGERSADIPRALISTLLLAMLLYTAVLINGQGMATAIVEEKSSRLIEVIIGAVTAGEFMAGKILGVLGSGLTQLAIWMVFALAALLKALPGLRVAAADSGMSLGQIFTGPLLFYFAVFFALGYLFYSVIFATIAVTCTSTEELGQSMFIGVLPMVVALMLTFSVFPNPNTMTTRILSLIPFFTPLVMLARVNILMPPLWEVWLGILLLLASALGAAWVAAKIFRYALLMTGKRPTLPELLAVIRAG